MINGTFIRVSIVLWIICRLRLLRTLCLIQEYIDNILSHNNSHFRLCNYQLHWHDDKEDDDNDDDDEDYADDDYNIHNLESLAISF